MPHPGEHKGKEGTARPSEAGFEVSTDNISSREVAEEVQPPGDQGGPPPVLLPILREAPGPTCPHRGGQRAGGGLVSRKVINFGSANFMTEFNTVLGRGVGGARDSEDSDPPPAPAPAPAPSLSFRFLHRGTLTIQATIQSGAFSHRARREDCLEVVLAPGMGSRSRREAPRPAHQYNWREGSGAGPGTR